MSSSSEKVTESKAVELTQVVEFGVALCVNKQSLSPKKNEGYYCQEMDMNRLGSVRGAEPVKI